MKIKKIKLLKALALTGAFGIVATVPVIVSSCSSTDNGGSGNNTGGNGGDNNTQNQTITPEIESAVTLKGSLSNIYDTSNTSSSNTDAKISEEIKKNLTSVFKNGEDLQKVSDLEVTVTHDFPASTWKGTAYAGDSGWSKTSGLTTVLYDYASEPLTISSLSNLKEQLTNDKIKEIFTEAGTQPDANTTYTVDKALGFTNKNNTGTENRDLLHINVVGTPTSGNPTNFDLQIPVSDLNLKIENLSIKVKGTNVPETTLTTTLTYNIGINEAENFSQPTTAPSVQNADKTDVNKALVALNYAKEESGKTTLDNEAISAGLGIYNCEFVADTISQPDAQKNEFVITLKATPKNGYVWEDGTNTEKSISFSVTFDVKTN